VDPVLPALEVHHVPELAPANQLAICSAFSQCVDNLIDELSVNLMRAAGVDQPAQLSVLSGEDVPAFHLLGTCCQLCHTTGSAHCEC
jgi:hypothetical protein